MPEPIFRSASSAAADNVTSLVIDLPAGTVEGDWLVAWMMSNNQSVVWDVPGIWDLVDVITVSAAGATGSAQQITLRAGASEPATYTFTVQGATLRFLQGGICCYMGTADNPLDAHTTLSEPTLLTTISTPDATTLVPDTLVTRCWIDGGATLTIDTPALAARERFRAVATSTARQVVVADEVQAAAGAVGIETATIVTAGGSLGYTTAYAGAAGGGAPTEELRPSAIIGGSAQNMERTLAELQTDVP